MGTKKQAAKVLFPLMVGWNWMSKEERKEEWKEFRSNMEKMWDQFQDLQKATKETAEKQWGKIFPQLMEMQQTVADSLSDEKATLPGMPSAPFSPKEFVEKAKEIQEKINEHAVEANNRAFEHIIQRQQQVKEMVTDAANDAEDTLDKVES